MTFIVSNRRTCVRIQKAENLLANRINIQQTELIVTKMIQKVEKYLEPDPDQFDEIGDEEELNLNALIIQDDQNDNHDQNDGDDDDEQVDIPVEEVENERADIQNVTEAEFFNLLHQVEREIFEITQILESREVMDVANVLYFLGIKLSTVIRNFEQ